LVEPDDPTPVSSKAEGTIAFSWLLRFGYTKAFPMTTESIFDSSRSADGASSFELSAPIDEDHGSGRCRS
jgi:hypothetical protein